jgi:hypothetical protein
MSSVRWWVVLILGGVVTSWSATDGGQWVTGILTVTFTLMLPVLFLAPSLDVAPYSVVYVEICAIVVAVVAFVRIDHPGEGFARSGVWSAAIMNIAVIAARLLSDRNAVSTPIVQPIAFPLSHGKWRVVEGDGRLFNHHWVVPEQRASLDIVRISRLGGSRRSLRSKANENYLAFGVEIHAPCSGTVTTVRDGLADGVPDAQHPAGNHVVIDNGTERILLAHMQQGSVTLVVGQQVRVGELIGRIGNSGNSTEPHLHIHAQSGGEPRRLVFEGIGGRFPKGKVLSITEDGNARHSAHDRS